MDLPQSNTQTPAYSYTLTELLSLRTKTFVIILSTVNRLKDLNIGYHLPHCHRSRRGIKRNKQNVHPFIVASFNAQLVMGNDMVCKHSEISTIFQQDLVSTSFDRKPVKEIIYVILHILFGVNNKQVTDRLVVQITEIKIPFLIVGVTRDDLKHHGKMPDARELITY